MHTATKRRRARRALLLATMYALMLLFSICVMFGEAGHFCTGFDCAVCKTVLSLHALLLQLAALLMLLRGAGRACPLCSRNAARLLRRLPPSTPVALCTRMND